MSGRGRGGRGGGGGGGRGRGGGGGSRPASGRGVGSSSGGGRTQHSGVPPRGTTSKEQRKEGRRRRQAEAVQRKSDAEEKYFRDCQREAAGGRGTNRVHTRSEDDLFKHQGSRGINFDNYDKIDVEVAGPGSDSTPPLAGFADLGRTVPPFLATNVGRMGYDRPTPIQKHAIPLALGGNDLMCCAQTGSGKTCAFLLPVAAALGSGAGGSGSGAGGSGSGAGGSGSGAGGSGSGGGNSPAAVGHVASVGDPASPRCVVLAPTRELAAQINVEAEKLLHQSGLRPVVVYGGADQKKQVRELAFGADVVVATPGRLTDFVERGIVSLSDVRFLVLDEADRMLDMGFEPQIRRIVLQADMPPKERRQTMLFSATFAPEVQKLAAAFLRPYVWIAVGRVGSTVENIDQRLILATPDKRKKLLLVVKALSEKDGRTLVFVQKKRTATWLKHQLRRGGPADGKPHEKFPPVLAEDIHGDRSQSQREAALSKFRAGTVRVLVATDVAARGLDIGGVEHVINMDLPLAKDDFDSYVHRIGRTGRAGHAGLATSLYVPGHEPKSGNGPIARSLMAQMEETGSEVPDWFADLPECRIGSTAGGGDGGGGAGGGAARKKKFGGSDVRGPSSSGQQPQEKRRRGQQAEPGARPRRR